MNDREKAIRILEGSYKNFVLRHNGELLTVNELIKLLKAQESATIEPMRIELADETKAWLDKMDAVDALGNIANICMDWDGYRTANGLGGLINEIWAYARYCANRLLKAQEPETSDAPKSDSDIGCWYDITHNYTLEQVVNALKAQEPMLLTLEEVRTLQDGALVWAEDNDKADVIPVIVNHVWNSLPNIVSFTTACMREVKADMIWYGVKWRCWTSRPDEKRRAETPWN